MRLFRVIFIHCAWSRRQGLFCAILHFFIVLTASRVHRVTTRVVTRTFMELELNLLEMYDMVVRWCLGFEVEEDCCATNINSCDEETSWLLLPKTGRTTKRAVSWANKMAGPAANMEAPNWYTCVGIPAKYNKNTGWPKIFYQVKLHPSQARANKNDFLIRKSTFPGW